MPPINCTSKWRMLHGAPAGLADYGKGLGQQLVEGFALGGLDRVGVGDAFELGGNARAEFDGLGPQLLVGELLDARFEVVDGGHDRPQLLDDAFVRGAKNFGKSFIEKHRNLRLPV